MAAADAVLRGWSDITGGETCFQRFGTGNLDSGQPMIKHRSQHLDELAVAIDMLGELGTDLSQTRR